MGAGFMMLISRPHEFPHAIHRTGIRRAEDITPAFEAIEGRADALYVPTEALARRQTVVI
jgi:ABC-type uncharacterized transport system substrate-binding protein